VPLEVGRFIEEDVAAAADLHSKRSWYPWSPLALRNRIFIGTSYMIIADLGYLKSFKENLIAEGRKKKNKIKKAL